MATRTRSSNGAASPRLIPGSSITNSSPPKRPIRSLARSTLLIRSATKVRTSSPALCPQKSLTPLKPSKSKSATVTGCLSFLEVRIWASLRLTNSARLSKPVNESTVACRIKADSGLVIPNAKGIARSQVSNPMKITCQM